jgi:ADP-ribose pyrophosphatase
MKSVPADHDAGTPDDAHLVETRIDSVEILKGSFLHAMRDTVGLPDGT